MATDDGNRSRLQTQLENMESLSNIFDQLAQSMDATPFIHVNGVLVQYVQLCKQSLANGIDFVMNPPTLKDTAAEYIAEKLLRVFPSLRNLDLLDYFTRAVQGTVVRLHRSREVHIVFSPDDAREWAKKISEGQEPLEAAVAVVKQNPSARFFFAPESR